MVHILFFDSLSFAASYNSLPNPIYACCQVLKRMPNSKGRQSKRKDQRKSILFEINRCSDSIVRRDLSIIEIDELFVNISNNQISKFGLEKLSKLQLDIIKENACLPNISLETADASPRTLLEYAIELGRDAIICQLFKAGADIFFRSCLCSSCAHLLAWRGSPMSRKVLARLKLRYYQNIVWILRVARSITSSCSDQICNVPTCEQSSSSSRCTGSRCLLVFPQCSHHVCEVCFWTSVTRLDPIDDLCCGVCARPIQDYPLSIQLSNSRRKFSPQCLITDSVVEVTNVCTKERSKDLWSQLPEQRCVADDEGERQSDQGNGQKPSFIAMSLNQLTSVFIGEVLWLLLLNYFNATILFLLTYLHVCSAKLIEI